MFSQAAKSGNTTRALRSSLLNLVLAQKANLSTHARTVIPLVINGVEYADNPELQFPVYCPVSGDVLHYAQGATLTQANEAADAAQAAFQKWRKVSPLERRKILHQVVDLLRQRRQENFDTYVSEAALPDWFAHMNADDISAHLMEWASLTTTLGGSLPLAETDNVLPLVVKEPVGPVLSIAPWNAPGILGMRAMGCPIAAGCTVVFRSSEQSPKSHYLLSKAFKDAGIPPGVLNVLHSAPESSPQTTQSLISNPHIKKINFTGSTAVGRAIGRSAGENLKPLLLELGGKAAAIVLSDADLEQAAQGVLNGAWSHNGQICMSTERVYVVKEVAERFLDILKTKAIQNESILSNNVLPHRNRGVAQKSLDLVSNALKEGATLVYGDPKLDNGKHSPIILGNVTEDMAIFDQETFGPVVYVEIVDSARDAVVKSNASQYGLSAGVWTSDIIKAIQIANDLESGAVHINGMTVHDESTLPHGGMKSSGFGRFGSHWGLNEFLNIKTITISGFSKGY